ncbi:hypothetical protein E4U39_006167 [Claviceps sp. Clav50 group G5]|nr:hypothetical protein E4U39_006167 [Claviceps sp. Clav50 group G5]
MCRNTISPADDRAGRGNHGGRYDKNHGPKTPPVERLLNRTYAREGTDPQAEKKNKPSHKTAVKQISGSERAEEPSDSDSRNEDLGKLNPPLGKSGGNAFVTPRIAKKLKYHRRASSEQLPEDMPIVRLGGKPGLVLRGWALGTKPDHRQPMRNSMPDVRNGHWQQRRDIGAQMDGETCRISKSKDKADYAAAQGLGIAGIGIATIGIVDA